MIKRTEEHRKQLNGFQVDRLIKLLSIEALKKHDGHLKFTTNYKVMLGTIGCDTYGELGKLRGFKTLKEAIVDVLVTSEQP